MPALPVAGLGHGACRHALLEVGGEEAERAAHEALDWLKPQQVLDVAGDWAAQRPDVRPAAGRSNTPMPHYPDLDDTAVVVMAMDRAAARLEPAAAAISQSRSSAAANGSSGLQSRDGGWGAFDADNTHHYLNNIPFADHGALLDPPTADVTAAASPCSRSSARRADEPGARARRRHG